MKNTVVMMAMILTSVNAFATPDFLRCSTSQGEVLFNFAPLSASWVKADGTTEPFLRYGTICNQDVSEMNPKPTCRVQDQSADHYLIQTLECQHDGQWFAEAFVEISQISKDGRFQCKSKSGSKADINLTLTDCRR